MRRLLPGLLLVCAARFIRAAEDPKPVEIPVVRTIEELKKAPELTLASGNKVRVGIEANTAPVGSQVVVYVLGEDESEIETDITDEISERIGPLLIHREKVERLDVKNLQEPDKDLKRAGAVLWCNAVSVRAEGTTVELEEFHSGKMERRTSKVVARASIGASKVEFHPWRVLGVPNELQELEQLADSDAAVLRVNAAEQYRAEAAFDGTRPVLYVDDERMESGERLPHLLTADDIESHETLTKEQAAAIDGLVENLGADEFDDREAASAKLLEFAFSGRQYLEAKRAASRDPEARNRLSRILNAADSGVRVEWSDDRLHIQFSTPIIFESDREVFLFRWWLNGKPLALEDHASPLEEKMVQLEQVHGVDIELADFDAQSLGAKSGDEITVQVLHSPHGSSRSGEKLARQRDQVERVDDRPGISNKFTITVR